MLFIPKICFSSTAFYGWQRQVFSGFLTGWRGSHTTPLIGLQLCLGDVRLDSLRLDVTYSTCLPATLFSFSHKYIYIAIFSLPAAAQIFFLTGK
ncbi:hypothetical protein XENTR_v10014412 [Xenopus tropicalis]|nr:hypothetical protein XENTR_v10014412 [Xenopus tropicalis]